VKFYLNGELVPHRPFQEDEYNALMRHVDDDIQRMFFVLENKPAKGGDAITCDEVPSGIDQVWVRFPFLDGRGNLSNGNMRIHP
jgi:hypothetical protein